MTGTSCNFLGALLGGVALRLCDLGSKASTISDVFRGGFISTFTSFCFMVEESAALQCGKSRRSLQYFLSCLLLGPCFFELGRHIGGQILGALQHFKHDKAYDDETTKVVLVRAQYIMTSVVVVAIAAEGQMRGLGAACELTIGVACSMAAVMVGDAVGILAQAVLDIDSEVNWGTIFANVLALLLLSIIRLCTPYAPNFGWLFSVLSAKLCGSFCGTLSGYGAFSEDVAGQLTNANIETAATNMGMNVLVAIVFMTVLEFASCGV